MATENIWLVSRKGVDFRIVCFNHITSLALRREIKSLAFLKFAAAESLKCVVVPLQYTSNHDSWCCIATQGVMLAHTPRPRQVQVVCPNI